MPIVACLFCGGDDALLHKHLRLFFPSFSSFPITLQRFPGLIRWFCPRQERMMVVIWSVTEHIACGLACKRVVFTHSVRRLLVVKVLWWWVIGSTQPHVVQWQDRKLEESWCSSFQSELVYSKLTGRSLEEFRIYIWTTLVLMWSLCVYVCVFLRKFGNDRNDLGLKQ